MPRRPTGTTNRKARTPAKKVAKPAKPPVKSASPRSIRAPRSAALANVPFLPPDARVPIPATNTFNHNLSSANEATMLQLFGVPGAKTSDCSPATGPFASRISSNVDVGPFRASGLDVAVASLKAVFGEAQTQIPQVVGAVKSDGMLCVRHKRLNPDSFSNHSWGTAIDLFFKDAPTPQGVHATQRGCLQLAPFFNKHGWYWGAGFSGGSVDSMHFELAEETIRAAASAPRPAAIASAQFAATGAEGLETQTFAGLDLAHFPGDQTMEAYQNSGFKIISIYLSHSEQGRDTGWIGACQELGKAGWGLIPIYFGAQLVNASGRPLPPPTDPLGTAASDAKAAIGLARAASLDGGRTLFLDIETTFPGGGAYESYLLKWSELIKQAGYKVAVYCRKATVPWAAANGLPAWTVHLNSESGTKDPRTGAIHWCFLESPLPSDEIDLGAIGTQTRFFCRAGGRDNEIDYDRFKVPDPSSM
jgi:hypothetical protein